MSRHDEQRIRMRAYELWEAAGCTGGSEEHWWRAERELASLTELNEPSSRAPRSLSVPGVSVAMDCGAKLQSYYDSVCVEAPPVRHWELAIELATGPEDDFRNLLAQ